MLKWHHCLSSLMSVSNVREEANKKLLNENTVPSKTMVGEDKKALIEETLRNDDFYRVEKFVEARWPELEMSISTIKCMLS